MNSGVLSIYNLTFANAGEYECIAKTVVGSIESHTTVYIDGPPSSPGIFKFFVIKTVILLHDFVKFSQSFYNFVGGLQVTDVSKKNVKLQWTDGSSNGRPLLYYIVSARTNWNRQWINITQGMTFA